MLSIILLFIASVTCFPFTSIFRGCLKPIEQELSITQGLKPELLNKKAFGYIYRLDTPTLRLGPDITVLSKTETFPTQAAMILSHISYSEFDTRLVFRGHLSKLNSYRLNRIENLNSTLITIQFETFDYKQNAWYTKLESSPHGITGRIDNFELQNQEIMIELLPELNTFQDEYLQYNSKRIDWYGLGKNGCRTHRQVNNKRDQFYEVFNSAVLL